MAGEREDYSKLPITAIVSLALAIMAWWLVSEPLVSTRQEGGRPASKYEQLLQARLWQDPIEAVQVDEAKGAVSGFGFEHKASAGHIAVLIVITEGGPYVENHEKRLRDRYAIVSALAAACFAPKDSEHIGSYLSPDLAKPTDASKPVPFEWYETHATERCHADEPFTSHYNRVLVVWATDSMLGSTPIDTLRKVINSLLFDYWNNACLNWQQQECFSKLAIKLIGPPDSPTLRTMLQSVSEGNTVLPVMYLLGSQYQPQPIELYSPWATADPEQLLRGMARTTNACSDVASCQLALKNRLGQVGLVLEHAVISDRELTLALALELRRRQIRLAEGSIVLISEWDTFYGRALPIAFEKNAKRIEPSMGQGTVRRYSYLRGLDGLTPEDSKKNEQRDAKKARSNSLQEATARAHSLYELERPDGQSQVDYLRRLAAKIKMDADHDGKPVKAIGVLGSDIHDTKLILKALRDEFSNVVFFTTSLDARMFEESDYPWTRNLIIASPFGLELHHHIQRDIPPFRDSYQTSAFFAVLRAVGHIQWSHPTAEDKVEVVCRETEERKSLPSNSYIVDYLWSIHSFSARLCPRIFEIGRHGPVDLSVDLASLDIQDDELPLQPVRELWPQGMKKWWPGALATERLEITGTVVTLGMTFAVFLLVFTRVLGKGANRFDDLTNEFSTGRARLGLMLGVGIICFIAILFGVLAYARDSAVREGWQGEPITLTDGVSIWPSVVIRLIVICWCMGCVILGWTTLRLDHATLRYNYRLSKPPSSSFWGHLQNLILSIRWVLTAPNTPCGTVQKIYEEYQKAGYMWCRLVRAAILTCIYLMFLQIVLAAFSDELPFNPCRGPSTCSFSDTILSIAVFGMILLNMFVFDAVVLCQGFVLRLKSVTAESGSAVLETQRRSEQQRNIPYFSSVLMVRLVADHTEALHRLVFCPFIALFLMISSRNRYFDAWDFPIGLVFIWVIYAFIALTSIARLKTAAARVRECALSHLQDRMIEGEGGNQNGAQIRLLMEEIRGVQKGAYAPFLWHPAFGTSLITVIALLQYWVFGR